MKSRYQIILLFFLLGYFISCNPEDNATVGSSPVESNDLLMSITSHQAEAIGLEFGKLQKILLSNSISCNGYLDTPPQYKAKISSIVSGKVIKINYLVGDHIKRGFEIIRLESIEFLEIQKNYISAKSTLKFLEDNYLRQKTLSEQNVNAKKDFLEAEMDYHSTRAEFEFISRKLDILQANKAEIENGNISPFLSIRSTINGYLTDIHATLGEFVDAEDIMVEVINPDHLHAELNIYENDATKIKKGQKVEITTKIMTESMIGEIFLIGKHLDENSRTIPIHVHIPENKNLLPGMYVDGKISLDEKYMLAIQEEGLIREEERSFVYTVIEEIDDTYILKRIEVKTGPEKNGMVAIEFPIPTDTSKLMATKGVYYLSAASD
jgi:cobalt-zinc-cadmium efflux system membrane fusion protein